MLKQIARLKAGLVLLLGILLFCSGAFAMDVINKGDNRNNNRGYNSNDNRGYNSNDNRQERHYYRDGRWYKHDSRGNEVAVTVLTNGALVESLPPQHTTIVVENTRYYHDDRYYYRQEPNGGYVVVSQPVIVQRQYQNNYDTRSQGNYNTQGERGSNSYNQGNRGENH
jgi:hypothetical protein